MKVFYKICSFIIVICFLTSIIAHFFPLSNWFGTWAVVRIIPILVLNGILFIILEYKTSKTDSIAFKKSLCWVILPILGSVGIFYVLGLDLFHKGYRKGIHFLDQHSVEPFEYSGLGWQDNCPRIYKGVEGKITGSIDERTICFSLAAPAACGDDVCSVFVTIKPKGEWEILGIGIETNSEKLVLGPTKTINDQEEHQYKIKELPCGDTIWFVCSLHQKSSGWWVTDIRDALSLSFKKANCLTRGEGGK